MMKALLKKPVFLLICDMLLLNGIVLAMFSIRFFGNVPERNLSAYESNGVFICVIYTLLFYFHGLYDFEETDDAIRIFFKVFSVTAIGTLFMITLTFMNRAFAFPRTVILLSLVVEVLSFSIWRLFVHATLLDMLKRRRVVVYGARDRIEHIAPFVGALRKRYEYIAGFETGQEDELRVLLDAGGADWLIITDNISSTQELAFELYLKHPDLTIFTMPKLSSIIAGARHNIVIGDVPLIAFCRKTPIGRMYLLKRLTDTTASILGIIFL